MGEGGEAVYTQERLAWLEQRKKDGDNPYPHKFEVSISVKSYIDKYSNTEIGTRIENAVESVAGRVMSIRTLGKKMCFCTIQSNGYSLQYFASAKEYESEEAFRTIVSQIHRGDIVGATGFVYKTKTKEGTGELSIIPKKLVIITPCLKLLPSQHFGLKDEELRVKKRYLDLILNPTSRNVFVTRNYVIKQIRNYLDNRDFISHRACSGNRWASRVRFARSACRWGRRAEGWVARRCSACRRR